MKKPLLSCLLRSRRMIGFKTILVDNTRVPITLPKKFARIFHHPTFFHPAAHGKNREKPYIVTFQQAKQATWKKMSHKLVINQPTRTSSCHFPWLFPMIHFPSPYNSHPAIPGVAGSCWTSSTNASLSWRNKWPWRGWCRSSTIVSCLGNWESRKIFGRQTSGTGGPGQKRCGFSRALGRREHLWGHVGRFSIFDSCFYFRVLMIWSAILIGWDGFVLNGADYGADYGADDIGLGWYIVIDGYGSIISNDPSQFPFCLVKSQSFWVKSNHNWPLLRLGGDGENDEATGGPRRHLVFPCPFSIWLTVVKSCSNIFSSPSVFFRANIQSPVFSWMISSHINHP